MAFTKCGLGEFSNCDIWTIDADGSNKTRLTTSAVFQETWPAWSPDGTQIAFTTNESDEFQDIWVMDADGSNSTQLTTTNGIFDAFPEWSPDGTTIAFTSDRDAIDDIWVMDPDGSDPVRLTTGTKVDERPDWSPDGATITFSRNGKDIWAIDADGSNPTQLTDSKRIEFGSVFSPDGTMIAFNREGPTGRFGVWVMQADGSGPTKLTSGRFDLFPDWPDKRFPLYALYPSRHLPAAEVRRRLEELSPQKRLITAEEVSALVLYLCSDAARGITGQALSLDGGTVV